MQLRGSTELEYRIHELGTRRLLAMKIQPDVVIAPGENGPEYRLNVKTIVAILAAMKTADDAICAATWVRGTDKGDLNRASDKLRAAMAMLKGEDHASRHPEIPAAANVPASGDDSP